MRYSSPTTTRIALLLAVTVPAFAAPPPSGAPPVEWGVRATPLPAGESTQVTGRIAAEAYGTWLAVEHYVVAPGRTYSSVRVVRIERAPDGAATVHLLGDAVPPEVQAAVAAAGANLQPWVPVANDIERVRHAIESRASAGPMRATYRLRGGDAVKALTRARPDAAALKLVIEAAVQPVSQPIYGFTYEVTSIAAGEMTGGVVTAGVPTNQAGAPLPLSLSGRVRLIRVPALAPSTALPTDHGAN